MSAIRPDLPALPQAQTGVPTGVRNAQAAFFRAALDQARAPQTPSPQTQAAPSAQIAAQTTSRAQAAEPDRIARPGSYLDIRV